MAHPLYEAIYRDGAMVKLGKVEVTVTYEESDGQLVVDVGTATHGMMIRGLPLERSVHRDAALYGFADAVLRQEPFGGPEMLRRRLKRSAPVSAPGAWRMNGPRW